MSIISFFFFSSRRRHTRLQGDWSSDVCSFRSLEVESELGFGALRVLVQQAPVYADHLERLLAQVVRLFGVEGEDLPGDFALGHDERRDRPCAQPSHRLQPVPAVRRPEALLGRGDRDHRVEKHSRAVEDVGELAVMRLRKVALEGRRLDALDRKNREEERVLPERIAVGTDNHAAFARYPDARFLGVARKRVEPALLRREAARAGLGLSRRALRGGALEPGFALGFRGRHGRYDERTGAGPGAARFFFSRNSNTPFPAIIAARKVSPFAEPAPARTSAGPGQMPASPQPTPNTRLPRMRRLSMRRGVGRSTGAPSSVCVRFFMWAKAPAPTATAPAMTSASEGSQAPARSRKPSTFAGFTIPETRRPRPKTKPVVKEAAVYMDMGPYCEIRWRATYTVAKPAAINASVATIERGDRRATPHTPWPLVHPPP